MYQSNYAAGLRVVSIADRENPVEVAFFDPTPDDSNEPELAGSWSNYPFFASGIIAFTNHSHHGTGVGLRGTCSSSG